MEGDKPEINQLTDQEILNYCLGELVDPLPTAQDGKLVLWYGQEWVEYDEHDESQANPYGMSRYPAGAYFETIALRPAVIQNPGYIADAALRINQVFDDEEFATRLVDGMESDNTLDQDQAKAILVQVADAGKAGHWLPIYVENHFNSEFSDEELAELATLDKAFYDWMMYEAHLVPMEPEKLGMAIAKCVPEGWIDTIAERMVTLVYSSVDDQQA